MRVTIGIRLAKKSPILTYTDKIYSPSVDTDGSYFYTYNPQNEALRFSRTKRSLL